MKKFFYRFSIVFGCLLTTTLAGCKPSAELAEFLINLGCRISSRIIGDMIQQAFNSFHNQQLPFTLKKGESYEKIKSNQKNYYVIHRVNGITEQYSMEGVLLWSNSSQQLNSSDTQLIITQKDLVKANKN
ncbi:hypothetical protein [Acinetobacter sp. ANC 4193]